MFQSIADTKDNVDEFIKRNEAAENFYERKERIGRGGFGKVYKCVNRNDGTIYAMKSVEFNQNEYTPEEINTGIKECLNEVIVNVALNES